MTATPRFCQVTPASKFPLQLSRKWQMSAIFKPLSKEGLDSQRKEDGLVLRGVPFSVWISFTLTACSDLRLQIAWVSRKNGLKTESEGVVAHTLQGAVVIRLKQGESINCSLFLIKPANQCITSGTRMSIFLSDIFAKEVITVIEGWLDKSTE